MEIAQHTERAKSGFQQRNESSLMQLDAQPGRTASINGKEFLFFSGYAYLGMHQCKEYIELVKEGTDKYGWSFPSSRISNTRLKLFDDFEDQLSSLTGFQNTVTVANGFTAGRMAVQLFAHKANFFIAPGTHPAVSEGFPKYQGNYENWKNYVITTLNERNPYSFPVIVSDSVTPLNAQVNDLSFLQYIERKCVCIIDDSHGIGLIGENGSGITKQLPANPNIDYVLVYSLSKAFNLNGGAIGTNNVSFAQQLKQMPAYTGGTAMNPALMFAFTKGQDLYSRQRERIQKNIQTFSTLIHNKTSLVHPHPELPIFIFNKEVNEEQLFEKSILISSFPYPDPAGKKVQRVVINSLHTEEDLVQLANAID
jgi:8-amino-7-oxononanoate synthase